MNQSVDQEPLLCINLMPPRNNSEDMPCNVKIIALSFIGWHSMFDIISISVVSKRASLFINIIFFQTCSRPVSSGFRVIITFTITFNVTTFNQKDSKMMN